MEQRFNSFNDLSKVRFEGIDYQINARKAGLNKPAVIAIHAGAIETSTGLIAELVAKDEFNFYSFSNISGCNVFYELHVTSSKFDEPKCLDLVSDSKTVFSIHGCKGDEAEVFIGGLDEEAKWQLKLAFDNAGIKAMTENHNFLGDQNSNPCNMGKNGKGVQIELSRAIRNDQSLIKKSSEAIRSVINKF